MSKHGEYTSRIAKRAGKLIRLTARFGKRYSDDRNGVTAIEFAFVGLPFLMIVFGILEMGLAFFVNRILDNAVQDSARMIRTGQAQGASFSADDFKDDVCGRLPGFLCDTDKFVVDVTTFESFDDLGDLESMTDDEGELKDDFTFEMGCASEIVVARAVYRWPLFTAFFEFDDGDTGSSERYLYSTAVFRNEPFPETSGTCA